MKILDVLKSHNISVRESGADDYWGECPLCEKDGINLLIDAYKNTYRTYCCGRRGSADALDRLIRAARVR